VISRIFDLISICFVLIAALLLSRIRIIPLYIVVLFASVLGLCVFMLIFWNRPLFGLIRKTSVIFLKINKNISIKITKYSEELMKAFAEIKSKKIIFIVFMSSMMISILSMAFTYFLVLALGYNLPLHVLIIVTTASILTTILPIYGIGGFGTVEGAWTIMMAYFNYPVGMAIILSFSTHILQLLMSALLGLAGWLGLKWKK
jgi:uncharacterized protein (TIRG00374 family)